MRKLAQILLFLLLAAGTPKAQIYNFKSYGLDEGLSQSQVSGICQDKEGYMWLGTEGGGLNRFDGKKFKAFTLSDGLSSNMVWDVICDSQGELWIATDKGVSHYDGNKFSTLKDNFGLSETAIWDVIEDKKGNIWFATEGLGVVCFDRTNFKKYGINDGLGFGSASKIFCDSHGKVWVGSSGYGLACFEKNKFRNVTLSTGLGADYITEIAEDKEGKIIVFTETGMWRLEGEEFQPVRFGTVRTDDVNFYLTDRFGFVWMSTISEGLYRIGEGDTLHFMEENGLPSNYIINLFKDHHGNIWAGFDGAGSCVYKGDRFIHYNKASGLPNNVIKCITNDQQGNYWFGSENGIAVFDGKNYKLILQEDGLPSGNIHALYTDSKNNIWIGSDRGPAVYTDGKIKSFEEIDYDEIGAVFCFFENKAENTFWLGTDEGVFEYNGTTLLHRFSDTIPDERIYKIRLLHKNEIWMCSSEGISVYKNKNFTKRQLRDEYGKLDALDCMEDPAGNVWVITGRGLVVYRTNGTVQNIKKKDGLSSDNLYLILYDGNYIWLGSDNGLDRLTTDDNWNISAVRHYGKSEGFVGVECNSNASLIDKKGRIWFGTIKGATCYIPQKDIENKEPPLLKLTGLRLMYEVVDWRMYYPELKAYHGLPENLVLNHSDNHLTFDFIGFEFVNPEKVKYQFMMEGFDENWLPVTYENSVTYSYLPPGEFTFRVKACNSDGYWSEPLEYHFVIDAPFWMKAWFYIIVIPLFFLFIYGFILYRTRSLAISKRELEEKVRVRTQELNLKTQKVEKLSIVASNMNEGVVICNSNGDIEWLNESFVRMAGHTHESFAESFYGKAKSILELSTNPDIDKIIKNFDRNPQTVVFDSSHIRADGVLIWTRGSIVPIYNSNDELQKIIVIYTDITDRKIAEQALEQWNKDLIDSVKYAKRIQEAILPNIHTLELQFHDSFVFYRPRDIVSGDFYWFTKVNNVFLWAVADCTGHGVPGAFMSMIGNEFLHQISKNEYVIGPEQCLYFLDKQITRALHQEGEDRESRDGMDIGLCAIHLDNLLCQFSGSNIPLYLIRNNELIEYDALKESIGGFNDRGKDFYSHEFYLQSGDILYMTSDGYPDQFGGDKGKKFMRKRFREMILKISSLPMKEQNAILIEEFDKWRGKRKQVDDVLVIAVKVP